MTAPSRYPLAWPQGRPRRPHHERKNGQFKRNGNWITIAQAVARVEAELGRIGARYPLLSSNLELRLDGQPRSGQADPKDPAVCLYFDLKGKPFALACDRYHHVQDNIAALAAHLDATRAIERHGVATAAETLQAFAALPPPPPGGSIIMGAVEPWHDVLGVAPNADVEVVQAAYRALAKKAHATGAGEDDLKRLNMARDRALKDLSA